MKRESVRVEILDESIIRLYIIIIFKHYTYRLKRYQGKNQ